MFVANAITVWVEAMKAIFDDDHPNPDLRDISIITDYPQVEVQYPSIWVNVVIQGDVSNAGIGHHELIPVDGPDPTWKQYLRWTFSGQVEFVINTMGNLERALVLDEVVRSIAISGSDNPDYSILREKVTQDPLIGMVASWESFVVGGFSENLGTPWGTDDVTYEATVSLPIEGETVVDPLTGALVPLSAIQITPLGPEDGDPPVITGDAPRPGVWV